jgi:cell division protein ZapB
LDTDAADRLAALEERYAALLARVEQLAIEHRALKARAQQLAQERARLAEQTATARSRVETMIERLRALERGG